MHSICSICALYRRKPQISISIRVRARGERKVWSIFWHINWCVNICINQYSDETEWRCRWITDHHTNRWPASKEFPLVIVVLNSVLRSRSINTRRTEAHCASPQKPNQTLITRLTHRKRRGVMVEGRGAERRAGSVQTNQIKCFASFV